MRYYRFQTGGRVEQPLGEDSNSPFMPVRFAIVEDGPEERGLYVEYLTRRRRLRCVGAYANAEHALRDIPTIGPDMVLMDLRLPGMSGKECAQRLKAALPKVKIVMITGDHRTPIGERLFWKRGGRLCDQAIPDE